MSGLGKGVTASSIGVLLKACGHRVTSIKIGTDGEWNGKQRKYPLILIFDTLLQIHI